MDWRLFLRTAVVQTLLVAALFAVLVALPLDEDFFEDYGWVSGPVAWVVCSVGTWRILSLPLGRVALAAVVGGAAGAVVGTGIDHTAGLVVAIVVFAAVCATRRS